MGDIDQSAVRWQESFDRSGAGSWPEYLSGLGVEPPSARFEIPPTGTPGMATIVVGQEGEEKKKWYVRGMWGQDTRGDNGLFCFVALTGSTPQMSFVPFERVHSFEPDLILNMESVERLLFRLEQLAHRYITGSKTQIGVLEALASVQGWLRDIGIEPPEIDIEQFKAGKTFEEWERQER